MTSIRGSGWGGRTHDGARSIDLPSYVELAGDLAVLDDAKILAAPADPADWPAWRGRLVAWRNDARQRTRYDGSHYEVPGREWTQTCYAVALVWLWDDQLYDHATGRFTPENGIRVHSRLRNGLPGRVVMDESAHRGQERIGLS